MNSFEKSFFKWSNGVIIKYFGAFSPIKKKLGGKVCKKKITINTSYDDYETAKKMDFANFWIKRHWQRQLAKPPLIIIIDIQFNRFDLLLLLLLNYYDYYYKTIKKNSHWKYFSLSLSLSDWHLIKQQQQRIKKTLTTLVIYVNNKYFTTEKRCFFTSKKKNYHSKHTHIIHLCFDFRIKKMFL